MKLDEIERKLFDTQSEELLAAKARIAELENQIKTRFEKIIEQSKLYELKRDSVLNSILTDSQFVEYNQRLSKL